MGGCDDSGVCRIKGQGHMIRHRHGEPTLSRMSPQDEAALIIKRAVRHLTSYSTSPELLLSTMRCPTSAEPTFPYQEIYSQGAANGGCALRMAVAPVEHEFDHRMYLVRGHPLTVEERSEVAKNRME